MITVQVQLNSYQIKLKLNKSMESNQSITLFFQTHRVQIPKDLQNICHVIYT